MFSFSPVSQLLTYLGCGLVDIFCEEYLTLKETKRNGRRTLGQWRLDFKGLMDVDPRHMKDKFKITLSKNYHLKHCNYCMNHSTYNSKPIHFAHKVWLFVWYVFKIKNIITFGPCNREVCCILGRKWILKFSLHKLFFFFFFTFKLKTTSLWTKS